MPIRFSCPPFNCRSQSLRRCCMCLQMLQLPAQKLPLTGLQRCSFNSQTMPQEQRSLPTPAQLAEPLQMWTVLNYLHREFIPQTLTDNMWLLFFTLSRTQSPQAKQLSHSSHHSCRMGVRLPFSKLPGA